MSMIMNTINSFTSIAFLGDKTREFLQGQLTCDMRKLDKHGTYSLAACCDHKGRMIANFWVINWRDQFYFVLPKEMVKIVVDHLTKYAMFSKVTLSETNDFLMMETNVHKTNGHDVLIALPGEQRFLLITKTSCSTEKADDAAWRKNNIDNRLAILTEKTSLLFTPQMIELEKLGGVSFDKGCYVGQEIVARTQHLGKLKRHLYRLTLTEHHEPSNKITYDGKSGVVVDSVKIGKNEYVALAVLCD